MKSPTAIAEGHSTVYFSGLSISIPQEVMGKLSLHHHQTLTPQGMEKVTEELKARWKEKPRLEVRMRDVWNLMKGFG